MNEMGWNEVFQIIAGFFISLIGSGAIIFAVPNSAKK